MSRAVSEKMVLRSLLLLFLVAAASTNGCHDPEAPKHGRFAVAQSPIDGAGFPSGATVAYTCVEGFQLLGPRTRECGRDGIWDPKEHPLCLSNVVVGRSASQSTGSNVTGEALFALDGNKTTCSETLAETSPWFAVDLDQSLPIAVVELNFRESVVPSAVHVTVRVGDANEAYDQNPVCSVFKGALLPGRSVYLPCTPGAGGRFVSVHLSGATSPLSLCEFVAYSEMMEATEEPATKAENHSVDAYVPFFYSLGLEGFIGVCVAVVIAVALSCVCCCLKKFRKFWFRQCGQAEFSMTVDETPRGKFCYVERPAKFYAPAWDVCSQEFPLPPGQTELFKRAETTLN